MLVAHDISKHFSGVIALDKVCLELHPGKVNAIVGENGAGKSTLMKILSGVYADYEGEILYNGSPIRFRNTKDAQAQGIVIIHQELNLVPELSVAENIFLGSELTTTYGLLDKRSMRERTRALLERLKLRVSPDTAVGTLKVGQQQVVEIAKALRNEAGVIIMDEPTSAIGETEVKVLFGIIRQLRRENKVIVYISHKLDELFAIADRYNVLRDGRFIEAGEMKDIDHEALVRKMVGREIILKQKAPGAGGASPLLVVKKMSLTQPGDKQKRVLKDISFRLNHGEVLGIFGLMGAGRTELLETMFGLHPRRSAGSVEIDGSAHHFTSPAEAIRAGLALVPEDRKKDGLMLGLSVRQNIGITTLSRLYTGGLLDRRKEAALARHYIDGLHIKTSGDTQLARNLSGGNQQKIVLAKWLARRPRVLMLDEPTRGIDIHAKSEIYTLIGELAGEGMGIIVVSSEMPEILAVSDRILVLCEGSLTAGFDIHEATEDRVLMAAIPKQILD